MAIAYLGLGSNLGNRKKNIDAALKQLTEHPICILKQSSIHETDPVGGPKQPQYLNCVVKIQTDISATNLLRVIQTIEKNLGRIRKEINGPRTIDIDILLYDHMSFSTPHLTIPHPRMWQREFVMQPLKEISPELCERIHENH